MTIALKKARGLDLLCIQVNLISTTLMSLIIITWITNNTTVLTNEISLILLTTFLPLTQSDYYLHHGPCCCLSFALGRSFMCRSAVNVCAALTLKPRSMSADLQAEPLQGRKYPASTQKPSSIPAAWTEKSCEHWTQLKRPLRKTTEQQCGDFICDYSIVFFCLKETVQCKMVLSTYHFHTCLHHQMGSETWIVESLTRYSGKKKCDVSFHLGWSRERKNPSQKIYSKNID